MKKTIDKFWKITWQAMIWLAATNSPHFAFAQYEYLSTLDYNNLALTQVGNIPDMEWVVVDNSTYDQNHQRFFFFGELPIGWPEQLYTIDAVTGTVIYNPVSPPGDAGGANVGHALGLHYDNVKDSLYALYFNLSDQSTSLAWIDPSTGTPHAISQIPNFSGYSESCFDAPDHVYILSGGGMITGLSAATGAILFQYSNINVSNLTFDNQNKKLYGVSYGSASSGFDSISLSTGAIYPIASLPGMSYAQIYCYGIDEINGKFVFVASNTGNPNCVLKSLYVLNLQTGAILYQALYPYAQATGNFNTENLIEFSFDNKRGGLYALNWYPPFANDPISISGPPMPACQDQPLTFTATTPNGDSATTFQWQVNGIDAGTNAPTFSTSALSNGDTVECVFTAVSSCINQVRDTSNPIILNLYTASAASVSIDALTSSICIGRTDTFVAHAQSAIASSGAVTIYQWQVNGVMAGSDDSVFSTNSLQTGDLVTCVITNSGGCLLPGPDTSNTVSVQVDSVNEALSIRASGDTICSGETVSFIAQPVNGGALPAYQWLVNGLAAGTNSDSFSSVALNNQDIVNCVLTSSLACAVPVASSDSITMTVHRVPFIVFDPDTLVIKPGASTSLNPLITGDISSYQWSPTSSLNAPTVADPIAAPSVTTKYALTVTGNAGCQATKTETVLVYIPFAMPSAFTPNGDGKNDIFRIPPVDPQSIRSFEVFNRWGQRVFSTFNSSQGWDGTLYGHPQDAGTYVWLIKYWDPLTKQPALAKGTVMLIR